MNIKLSLVIFFSFFSFFLRAQPPSSILIDAVTGQEIASYNADQRRYPASLTKVMTAFITFDALKSRKISLDDYLTITPGAVHKMPNFKLYHKAGAQITVDQALRATLVKSANDAATSLGEHVAGSLSGFVRLMNQKVRQLGLENTQFDNAAGIPNPRQYSTARDMAKLARAVLKEHPEYAYFFSIPYFHFHNRKYKNSNSLLGAISGVDGMKTGYTQVARHCLIASQKLDGRHVIGVVMGESSAHRRDLLMTYLLEKQTPTLAQIREAERKIHRSRRDLGVVYYWAVQTGAFRTRKQAIAFNKQLKKEHRYLFKEQNFFTRLANSVRLRKKAYTTRVGRFSSKEDAQKLCNSMKKKSLSCMVVKNS
ncbi:MAG: D-alanyl-D-alanine carboxypeptidase [Alphaproteobacteria bacterium]